MPDSIRNDIRPLAGTPLSADGFLLGRVMPSALPHKRGATIEFFGITHQLLLPISPH